MLLIRLLLLLSIFFPRLSYAQHWQQRVNYQIDVTLNDSDRTLEGYVKITYFNNSPDTLRSIPFHLWPNAYKNDKTAFSEQMLKLGDTRFYFASKEQQGYINRLDFKVNGINAKLETDPHHIDLATLLLPQLLAPNQHVVITTPFFVKLPYNFSRGGFDGNSFQLTQWYPKPAVYDRKGWHPMPYLHQGEFFSDFGTFDVRITVPAQYIVAATGKLQQEQTTTHQQTNIPETLITARKQQPNNSSKKTFSKKRVPDTSTTQFQHADSNQVKTLHFTQDNVHDFALFAAPDFIVQKDTCRLPSGRVIEVAAYYTPQQEKVWQNAIAMIKEAVLFRSRLVGEYPYGVVTAVQGPKSFGGGMEYPTITIISPQNDPMVLAELIGHEVGHNWFQGILASNERTHPWLDEGLNSYYDRRHRREHAAIAFGEGKNAVPDLGLLLNKGEELVLETKVRQKLAQPINTPAQDMNLLNYILVTYTKTALWLESLEARIGRERFDAAMQAYYEQWKFRHPYPEDFKRALEKSTGLDLSDFFAQLDEKENITNPVKRGVRVATPLRPQTIAAYLRKPTETMILVGFAPGFNYYDKFMAGLLLTNYKAPPSRLQFIAAPLYATGSKQLNGIGRVGYNIYSLGAIRRTEVFISGARFARDAFKAENGEKAIANFAKLVPGIRITFREPHPSSSLRTTLQWKSFLIKEGAFNYRMDTTIIDADTSFSTVAGVTNNNRTLHQLRFTISNLRALYPYSLQAQVESGRQFVRPAITANYFFNYAGGGGLEARFFGGAMLYPKGRTIQKEFTTDRYHLNMTGPNGYQDYTYSNYFISRSEFDGPASQQIMIRDGGFKLRTNLLASPIGRSSQWLLALNFSSTLPKKFNPLSILPIKVPLKVFADAGTYAEAWKESNEGSRFLFNAGLQLPLFGDLVDVYFPVVYSSPFRDYVKANISDNRFWKTISFSIQIKQRPLNKVLKEVDL